jgi:hypothetical protein
VSADSLLKFEDYAPGSGRESLHLCSAEALSCGYVSHANLYVQRLLRHV